MNRIFLSVPATLFDYQKIKDDFDGIVQGRWITLENLHLTLCFFGADYDKEFLIDKLSTLKLKTEPSELKGIGFFEHNKILYAKVQSPAIHSLHLQITKALNIIDTQEFIPHITLMRIKTINDISLLKNTIQTYKTETIGELDPTLQLLQSHLNPDGASYTLLHDFSR